MEVTGLPLQDVKDQFSSCLQIDIRDVKVCVLYNNHFQFWMVLNNIKLSS